MIVMHHTPNPLNVMSWCYYYSKNDYFTVDLTVKLQICQFLCPRDIAYSTNQLHATH